MRFVPFLISSVVTLALIFALNNKWGTAPRMGPFLSPQHGFWQNAEATGIDHGEEICFPGMKGKVEVILDDRLVPHIFADNDEDAYFAQGYLHAKFRLFQMDLQTKAAEGRASEIAGEKAVAYDREQRRLGLRFGAENALKGIEKDPLLKSILDAYTNGVNAYIGSLKKSEIPIEYKILDIEPEKWSNIRTALLLKMMAKMLSSGVENDLESARAKNFFSDEELKVIYPDAHDSLVPIIPKGTAFAAPGIIPIPPPTRDSLYLQIKDTIQHREIYRPDLNNGSNNWVVGGERTSVGRPILANDPHLELSLPSIWYEMQIKTPTSNCYGVTLPGCPFIVIGFTDSVAWGLTNTQRDVKDYYEIRFRDESQKEYWFNSRWVPVQQRIEEIKVKNGNTVYDTVPYTIFGPVVEYENIETDKKSLKKLALRWTAHDPSNEVVVFYKLNRAKNYPDYMDAIKNFVCPAQNFVFGSKSGDIAIWQQGRFPARWNRQGLYPMPGEDSSYMWQGFIPQEENPHILNPPQGFLQSANQRPVDTTYPYFIPGNYITPRGVSVYNKLSGMTDVKPSDMMALQSDYFNTLAEDARPLLLKYIREAELDTGAKKYLEIVQNWDLLATPESIGQTIFECWLDSIQVAIWRDDLIRTSPSFRWPDEQTTIEALLRDSTFKYIDNINTAPKETIQDLVTWAFSTASVDLKRKEAEGKLEWWKFKNPTIYHILKEPLLAFARSGLKVGGNGNIINAITHSHGPSWRMIVQLTDKTLAYGVYPGGQSGNPGSKYYDMFVDNWVTGKYYELWFMTDADRKDPKAKWRIHFSKDNGKEDE